jgi:hypothetical protein
MRICDTYVQKRKETHGLSSYVQNYLPQRLLLCQTITRGETQQLGVCTKGNGKGQCMVQGNIENPG